MEDTRAERYARTLAELIRCETVSVIGQTGGEKFDRFHRLLQETFPHLFAAAQLEEFDGSLLLRWPGQTREMPILLMSHHDVVEASGPWSHPPFAGEMDGGRLWGRGTLDTKGSLWAMLQAAEELAAEGFVPRCDIWFESACTEETDGAGADRISQELQKRGVRFRMTLDEGGMIMADPLGSGGGGTFAMIGVGEKGCADLKFVARSSGGHASTPGKNTPLVRLGKFMAAAESGSCFKAELSPVVEEMLRRMAPTVSGPTGKLMANAGKFRGPLCAAIPRLSTTAGAMLKTTLAFTMAQGSQGRNVLPQEAWIIGNMRYSHHQGREDSIARIQALAKKYDIETQVLDGGTPSHITDYRSPGFRLVEEAVGQVFPGVIPAPYIMTGASDSRYFSRVSDCCIRFTPFRIDQQQLASIHGVDENINIDTLPGAVDFYQFIIRRA